MKMKKPQVGDDVHYAPPGTGIPCQAAKVTALWTEADDEGVVSLTVFAPGEIKHLDAVHHSVEDEDFPAWHYNDRSAYVADETETEAADDGDPSLLGALRSLGQAIITSITTAPSPVAQALIDDGMTEAHARQAVAAYLELGPITKAQGERLATREPAERNAHLTEWYAMGEDWTAEPVLNVIRAAEKHLELALAEAEAKAKAEAAEPALDREELGRILAEERPGHSDEDRASIVSMYCMIPYTGAKLDQLARQPELAAEAIVAARFPNRGSIMAMALVRRRRDQLAAKGSAT